jgi:hypothetical protein
LHYICSLFDSVFYCTKREKGLGLVNCELYSAVLIRLVVPSFPNMHQLPNKNFNFRRY